MLIGRVSDGKDSSNANTENAEVNSNYHEFKTANELYEIMAENHQFHNRDETLTADDLVILYKNLDVNTNLMTDAKFSQTNPTNQYVETIIYSDDRDSDESDVGEVFSSEDMHNLIMINKERMDLLNCVSYDNNLCHKYGNVALDHNNLNSSYRNQFFFKDPFIKDQLKNYMSNETNMLPNSLLDYICCKRLEDDYNFYMDSVITYVQHTIEHLKRISNGDYLTDKAKKKWREVNAFNTNSNQILANSISIPLQVQSAGKVITKLDDVIHSEVDVRTLSKILQKKIILQIPTLLSGTYKLFSQYYNDNLIITCNKESDNNDTRSRVDVVLKLKKSHSGHVMSKINSIMILKKSPVASIQDMYKPEPVPALCYNNENMECVGASPKIVELNEDDDITKENIYESGLFTNKSRETYEDSLLGTDTDMSSMSPQGKNQDNTDTFIFYQDINDDKTYSDEQTEANLSVTSPNNLYCNLQRVSMISPVPEECEVPIKKKSATKVRIKSPYENSSHAIEEKKRKRLLEIRQKRESRKKALNENCKVTKHKSSKGGVTAQASSSVTKLLSITNKSFYNSIYGQANNVESKHTKFGRKNPNEDLKTVVEMESCDEDLHKNSPKSEKNKEKYINHSYYLDDADTEVMHLQMKHNTSDTENTTGVGTMSSSAASDDFGSNISILRELLSPMSLKNKQLNIYSDSPRSIRQPPEPVYPESDDEDSISNMVPANTPKQENLTNVCKNKKEYSPADECRKSIDEIYHLMSGDQNEIGTLNAGSKKDEISSKTLGDGTSILADKDSSSIQQSDSGTSVKHHIMSSVPSCFSFEKKNTDVQPKQILSKRSEIPVSVSSKILNNNKNVLSRSSDDKTKKERRKISSPVSKISQNPLKAISQLLHEFDNINKVRIKHEPKQNRKADCENKPKNRQVTFKRPLLQEPHLKDSEPASRVTTPKGRRPRQNANVNGSRVAAVKPSLDDKPYLDKFNRKKVIDLIDEVKEARGEAVRGPPKFQSRLDSLAQPKKAYIQAHNEHYPTKSARNVSNKQRLTVNPTLTDRRGSLNLRQKAPRDTAVTQKSSSAVPPLGYRRSRSKSPDGNRKGSPVSITAASCKPNISEVPETLMKKMVTVESYVNHHYGRSAQTQDFKDFLGAQKSRVPLIPTDLDIGSVTSSRTAEESTTLGKKLHLMIDTMINTATPALAPPPQESKEISSSNDDITDAFVEKGEQCYELISNTEFPSDIFYDKSITTAVASLCKDKNTEETVFKANIDFIPYNIQPFNSTTELERLENALYRRLSAGAFQKRLRIKNLTLTPKHSLPQVFVLHSGDAGSVIVKSTVSENVTKHNSKTSVDCNPVKSHVDLTFANFPPHIATLGYAMVSTDCEKETVSKLLDTEHCCDAVEFEPVFSNSQLLNECSATNIFCEQEIQAKSVQHLENPPEMKNVCVKLSFQALGDVMCQNTEITSNQDDGTKESQDTRTELMFSNANNLNTPEIDNSTSLDILLGLLNEIKNITTCQTNITKHETNLDVNNEESECKELQYILRNAIRQDDSAQHSPEVIKSYESLSPVDQLRYVATSIPCASDSVQYKYKDIPICQDKEVNVSIAGIEYVHTFTEVPSRFLPITTHHSTNVTSSLIGVISEPSEQSLLSFSDYQSLCNYFCQKIIELPINGESKKSLNVKRLEIINNMDETALKSIFKQKLKITNEIKLEDLSKKDRLFKIKRDVLVTVYSILVMTVFAALSFPQILYRS